MVKVFLNRLLEHNRNPKKDYWTEAIAITTSNDSLGPTEISYLEHRFCQLAIEANRYEVKTVMIQRRVIHPKKSRVSWRSLLIMPRQSLAH